MRERDLGTAEVRAPADDPNGRDAIGRLAGCVSRIWCTASHRIRTRGRSFSLRCWCCHPHPRAVVLRLRGCLVIGYPGRDRLWCIRSGAATGLQQSTAAQAVVLRRRGS